MTPITNGLNTYKHIAKHISLYIFAFVMFNYYSQAVAQDFTKCVNDTIRTGLKLQAKSSGEYNVRGKAESKSDDLFRLKESRLYKITSACLSEEDSQYNLWVYIIDETNGKCKDQTKHPACSGWTVYKYFSKKDGAIKNFEEIEGSDEDFDNLVKHRDELNKPQINYPQGSEDENGEYEEYEEKDDKDEEVEDKTLVDQGGSGQVDADPDDNVDPPPGGVKNALPMISFLLAIVLIVALGIFAFIVMGKFRQLEGDIEDMAPANQTNDPRYPHIPQQPMKDDASNAEFKRRVAGHIKSLTERVDGLDKQVAIAESYKAQIDRANNQLDKLKEQIKKVAGAASSGGPDSAGGAPSAFANDFPLAEMVLSRFMSLQPSQESMPPQAAMNADRFLLLSDALIEEIRECYRQNKNSLDDSISPDEKKDVVNDIANLQQSMKELSEQLETAHAEIRPLPMITGDPSDAGQNLQLGFDDYLKTKTPEFFGRLGASKNLMNDIFEDYLRFVSSQMETVINSLSQSSSTRQSDAKQNEMICLSLYKSIFGMHRKQMEKYLKYKSREDSQSSIVAEFYKSLLQSFGQYFTNAQEFGFSRIIPKKMDIFDNELHKSMVRETNPDLPDNTITSVISQGFMFQEKVVEPAEVAVNKR